MHIILETPRLTLRQFTEHDVGPVRTTPYQGADSSMAPSTARLSTRWPSPNGRRARLAMPTAPDRNSRYGVTTGHNMRGSGIMAFSGWPEEALDFYDGLAVDNSKSYWTEHKAVYED